MEILSNQDIYYLAMIIFYQLEIQEQKCSKRSVLAIYGEGQSYLSWLEAKKKRLKERRREL